MSFRQIKVIEGYRWVYIIRFFCVKVLFQEAGKFLSGWKTRPFGGLADAIHSVLNMKRARPVFPPLEMGQPEIRP
ncbi:hypothetical protein P0082_00275 [Candidatus Haliotispira prima]|uniref:Transposase DDE domain-containing protein n=1 Tax=Candidatus Haliotispira prima TaxID=3034016 RepID=A0ABY8MHJ5_9SPIO|nr:hypothetical protein P0082_00275 [Candidatus Haliotispira prima]